MNLNAYNIFRCDRSDKTSTKVRGGGILIAIKKSLKATKLLLVNDDVEQLFILCSYNSKEFIIGGVYLPPQSLDEKYLSHVQVLEDIRSRYSSIDFYVFGDYNLPDTSWTNGNLGATGFGQKSSSIIISQSYAFLNFFQHINIPNSRNVFLDLLFSNVISLTVNEAFDPLFLSSTHHKAYSFELHMGTNKNNMNYREYYYDFKNADYTGLNNFLAPINWSQYLDLKNITEATDNFYHIINLAIALFVPRKLYRTSTFPVWFSSELKHLVTQKKIVHKKFKETRNILFYREFSAIRDRCKIVSNLCYNKYLQKVENNLRADSRSFWKFMNHKNSSYSLPNNMFLGDAKAEGGQEIVQLFARHFSNIYVENVSNNAMLSSSNPLNVNINCSKFSATDLYEKINSLPDKLTTGPDGIPNVFLKKCICSFVNPLLILFNNSLETGSFPEVWKNSFITPIFKAGERENIENYRGVAIQSAIPKLFDSLVNDKITFQVKELLDTRQHGFTHNRSTVTNLMAYESKILRALENKSQVDCIYTDFSKAFDRVDHKLLLLKLKNIGFNELLLKWLSSFLTGRRQRIKAGSYISDEINVHSGVPQGSHCAPLLFNLFINDIGNSFKYCDYLLFADDLKIFMPIQSVDDQMLLQEDVNNLSQWCVENKLNLNIDKCCSISFFKMNKKFISSYHIDNKVLRSVSSIKDLGVIMDEQLTFIEHINNITVKSSKILGYVTRNCRHFSVNTFKMVYLSLVVSHLEYSSIIWSPYYHVHSNTIEKVQNKFLRYCAYKMQYTIEDHNYSNIMKELNLQSLKTRRTINDLCFIYKLLNGSINSPELLELITFNIPKKNFRNHNLFFIALHSSNYGQHSPIDRTLRIINQYNIDIFEGSLFSFKKKIKSIFL